MLIRSLLPSDLPAANALLQSAFETPVDLRPELERYLAVQPDGWFLAEDAGAVVGSVGVTDHGRCAYLGLLAVRRDARRRGTGTALLQHALAWADSRRIGSILLEATDASEALYRRFGFRHAGLSHEMGCRRVEVPSTMSDPGGCEVGEATDWRVVRDIDHEIFGADRGPMWRVLVGQSPGRTLLAWSPAGRLLGYLCVVGQTLGPWGAWSDAAARTLLRAASRRLCPAGAEAVVPADNPAARTLLEACGFRHARTHVHMRRGGELAARWDHLYGKSGAVLG